MITSSWLTKGAAGPPARRTTVSMKLCLKIAKDDNLQHVFGFTRLPMLSARLGFDYALDCCTEWMHALARIFTMFVSILFGGHGESTRAKTWNSSGTDHKHRLQCATLNIFPSVRVNRCITLTDEQREGLLSDTNRRRHQRFYPTQVCHHPTFIISVKCKFMILRLWSFCLDTVIKFAWSLFSG